MMQQPCSRCVRVCVNPGTVHVQTTVDLQLYPSGVFFTSQYFNCPFVVIAITWELKLHVVDVLFDKYSI